MSYWQEKQAALRAEAEKPAKKPKKPKKQSATLPEDLNEMSFKDLRALAAEIDLPGRSTMTKKDLVKSMS
jgi:hypothetical protein